MVSEKGYKMQSSKHDTQSDAAAILSCPSMSSIMTVRERLTRLDLVTLLNYWLMDSGENQPVSPLVPTGESSRFQEVVENP